MLRIKCVNNMILIKCVLNSIVSLILIIALFSMSTDHKQIAERSKEDEMRIDGNETKTAANEPPDFETSDFETLVNRSTFVDKTMLVKTLLDTPERDVIISAPLKFGKSTNLKMLKRFFEIQLTDEGIPLAETMPMNQTTNYLLFRNNSVTEIGKHADFVEQHLGRYPVVEVNFKCDDGRTNVSGIRDALEFWRRIIRRTFRQHAYLSTSAKIDEDRREKCKMWIRPESGETASENDVVNGLQTLLNSMYEHYERRRIIVLLDDYDWPIKQAALYADDPAQSNRMVELWTAIVRSVLNGRNNERVERTVITGISYVDPTVFDAQGIGCYGFLGEHRFARYYGLTEEEVNRLFRKTDAKTRARIRASYNGYKTAANNRTATTRLYNPWSTLHFLKRKRFADYWIRRQEERDGAGEVIRRNLKRALNSTETRIKFELLLQGKSLNITSIRTKNGIGHFGDLVSKLSEEYSFDNNSRNDNTRRRNKNDDNCSYRNDKADTIFCSLLEQGYFSVLGKSQVKDDATYNYNNRSETFEITVPNEEIERYFARLLNEYYETAPDFDANLIDECRRMLHQLPSLISSTTTEYGKFKRWLTEFQGNLKRIFEVFLNFRTASYLEESTRSLHCLMFYVAYGTDFTCSTDMVTSADNSEDKTHILMIKRNDKFAIVLEMRYNETAKVTWERIIKRYCFSEVLSKATTSNGIQEYTVLVINMEGRTTKPSVSYLINSKNATNSQ